MTFITKTYLDRRQIMAVGLAVSACLIGITALGYAQTGLGAGDPSVAWECRTGIAAPALPLNMGDGEEMDDSEVTGQRRERQIFLWDELGPGKPRQVQVTNTSRLDTDISGLDGACANIQPSMGDQYPQGLTMAFISERAASPGNCMGAGRGTICPCIGCPGNPFGNHELFLAIRDTQGRFSFRQITRMPMRDGAFQNLFPSISSDGTRVAFLSNRNYVGRNPNRNFEIFLWQDGATPPIQQITQMMNPDPKVPFNSRPLISGFGTRIVFASQADRVRPNPGGDMVMPNPDGLSQIYLYDIPSDRLIQITNAMDGDGAFAPSIDWSDPLGPTSIAFHSNSDLVKGGNPDGNYQIYRWIEGSGIEQITFTRGKGGHDNESFSATIARRDGQIAFVSNVRDTTQLDPCQQCPGNSDGNHEIFLWTEGRGFRQITDTTGGKLGSVIANSAPAINYDGSRISFLSNRDTTPAQGRPQLSPCFLSPISTVRCPGNRGQNNEVFIWVQEADRFGRPARFVQVTNTGGGNSCPVCIPVGGPANVIDHSGGFACNGDLTANGTASYPGSLARLTSGGFKQAGSIFSNRRMAIDRFETTFTIHIHQPGSDPLADGIAFVIQDNSPTALFVDGGGGLGYGPDEPGLPQGIRDSVAIKFDIYNNAGEGDNSTGIFTDGRSPTVRQAGLPDSIPDRSIDLGDPSNPATAINLHSQHPMRVDMTYDGAVLNVTITDTVTLRSAMQSYTVDIPSFVNSDTAFVGFTAATGGLAATQDVQTWTFRSTSK